MRDICVFVASDSVFTEVSRKEQRGLQDQTHPQRLLFDAFSQRVSNGSARGNGEGDLPIQPAVHPQGEQKAPLRPTHRRTETSILGSVFSQVNSSLLAIGAS